MTRFTKQISKLLAIGLFCGGLPYSTISIARGQEAQDNQVVEPSPEELIPETAADFDNDAEFKKFEELMAEWRGTVAEMRAAMLSFHNGTPEEGPKHLQRYRELEDLGRKQFDATFLQAMRLLEKAPRDNFLAAQYLLIAVHYRFERDWYENTGEAAELLMRVQAKDEALEEIAGVSFFATGQLEKARPHLQKARELGKIKDYNYPLLEEIEFVKPLWEREQEARLAEQAKDDLPRVRLLTTRGEIIVELFEDKVPNTVANFIALAEDGYLDDLPFYQVVPGRIALIGDNSGDGAGNIEFGLADEDVGPDSRPMWRGSLAMAKLPDVRTPNGVETIPNTASAQFFIAFQPLSQVHEQHTVFGRIIEGIAAFSSINRHDAGKKGDDAEMQLPPDRILSAEVIRRRDHPYKPERINKPPLKIVEEFLSNSENIPPAEPPQ